jgi:hypothetical protein
MRAAARWLLSETPEGWPVYVSNRKTNNLFLFFGGPANSITIQAVFHTCIMELAGPPKNKKTGLGLSASMHRPPLRGLI